MMMMMMMMMMTSVFFVLRAHFACLIATTVVTSDEVSKSGISPLCNFHQLHGNSFLLGPNAFWVLLLLFLLLLLLLGNYYTDIYCYILILYLIMSLRSI